MQRLCSSPSPLRVLVLALLVVALGPTLAGAATGPSAAGPSPLPGLEQIDLRRTQRPAVAEVVRAYGRALARIQQRLEAGELSRDEAVRQAGLAFQHLEQRLADILTPEQLARFRAVSQARAGR